MDETLETTINDLKALLFLFGELEFQTLSTEDVKKGVMYLEALKKIKKLMFAAFDNPETSNIDLHRAQVLANVKAVFDYDLKED